MFALFLDDDNVQTDDSGVNAIYVVTVFFALGIWIVFRRYENVRNRPVEFQWPAPEVNIHLAKYSA